jgi:hypothetical protein
VLPVNKNVANIHSIPLHVANVDTGTVDPGIIPVVGTPYDMSDCIQQLRASILTFDEHDLQVRVGIGQTTCDDATSGTTASDNNVNLLGVTHCSGRGKGVLSGGFSREATLAGCLRV